MKPNTIKRSSKIYFLSLIVATSISSCNKEIVDNKKKYANIKFNIGMSINDFSIKTKSTSEELATTSNSIDFYDYINGNIKNEVHQKKTDTGYGSISGLLEYGDHDCYIVAHNSSTIVNESDLFNFDKVTDTFQWYQKIKVDGTTEPVVNATLTRAVGKLEIEALDAIPINASSIIITLDRYSSKMKMNTGVGESNLLSMSRIFSYSDAQKGMKNTMYSIYSFIPNDTYTVDVTIQILDANKDDINVVTIKNAPIYKNKITHYSGNLFSLTEGFSLNIDNAWGGTINYNF